MKISKPLLAVAGLLSFSVALFQLAITFSPEVGLYFGISENVASNARNLQATGTVTAVTFAMFGVYALSGAGVVAPMPLLRFGLLGIGIAHVVRGLTAIPILLVRIGYLQSFGSVPNSEPATSLVSLGIGIVYLAGTISGWRSLPKTAKPQPDNQRSS